MHIICPNSQKNLMKFDAEVSEEELHLQKCDGLIKRQMDMTKTYLPTKEGEKYLTFKKTLKEISKNV